MAAWEYPTVDTLSDAVKVKDADNKIQHAMNDLNAWVNNSGAYEGTGFGATELTQFEEDGATAIQTLEDTIASIIDDTLVVEW